MRIRYIPADPAGNLTALTLTQIRPEERAAVAALSGGVRAGRLYRERGGKGGASETGYDGRRILRKRGEGVCLLGGSAEGRRGKLAEHLHQRCVSAGRCRA